MGLLALTTLEVFVRLVLIWIFTALMVISFFFFNDTATTEIYTLSLHDALPISVGSWLVCVQDAVQQREIRLIFRKQGARKRSEEHTSELQSRLHLVCRLLLEKKKKNACSR